MLKGHHYKTSITKLLCIQKIQRCRRFALHTVPPNYWLFTDLHLPTTCKIKNNQRAGARRRGQVEAKQVATRTSTEAGCFLRPTPPLLRQCLPFFLRTRVSNLWSFGAHSNKKTEEVHPSVRTAENLGCHCRPQAASLYPRTTQGKDRLVPARPACAPTFEAPALGQSLVRRGLTPCTPGLAGEDP